MRIFAGNCAVLPLVFSLGVGFSLLASCTDPATHVSWEPLSENDVSVALREPTGTLTELTETELLAQVESRMPAMLEAMRFVGRVIQVTEAVADGDYADKQSELPEVAVVDSSQDNSWGTSLYLRVACPGGNVAAPSQNFSAGEVRIDSPELKGLELLELLQGGELLLSFNDCDLGSTVLNAEIPSRYLLEPSRLGWDLADDSGVPAIVLALNGRAIDFDGGPVPLGVMAFGCGGGVPCSTDVRALFEVDAGADGTYVVGLRLKEEAWLARSELTLQIRGKDGQSTCTLTYSRVGTPALNCSSD